MKNPTLIFTEACQAEVRDVGIPEPESGKMLIETEVTAISVGTEMTAFRGDNAPGTLWGRVTYPRRSGYCNVGTVRDTGPGIDRAWIGKRVQSYGGHGKFVLQPLETVRPVRADAVSEQAVFATMAEIALHGVRRSDVGLGSAVVVYGLGLLGQMAVRFARLAGARPVLAADVTAARLARLPDDSAVIGANPKETDMVEQVRAVTGGRMADVAIELTGNPRVIPDQLALLRRGGTLAIVSGPRGKTELDFHDLCVVPSLRILGLHNGSHPTQPSAWDPWTKNRDVEFFLDLIAEGEFQMHTLISDRIAYADAPGMYRRLLDDAGSVMGVVVDWTTE